MKYSTNINESDFSKNTDIEVRYSEQIRIDLLNLTYKQVSNFSISTTYSSILLLYIFWDKVPLNTLMTWFGILNVVLLMSGIAFYRVQKFGVKPHNARFYRLYLYVMGFARGCIWGSIAITMYIPDDISYQLILLVFVSLGPAIIILVSAADRLLFFLIVIPVMTPITVQFFIEQNLFYLIIAIINIIYIGILYFFYRNSHTTLLKSIISQFEKTELASQLELEKQVSEKANKDKSRFLALASHDLRQPIHAQTLIIQELSERIENLKIVELTDLVRDLKISTSSLHELFDGLLDISKLDSDAVETHIEIFSLREILDTIYLEYKNIAKGKNIKLRIKAPDVYISSDRNLLHRIIHNFVSNALKHSQEGDSILLAARRRNHGKAIRIEIRDSGIGIPLEQQTAIFQEYYQITDSKQTQTAGLGLGLSIVQRLSKLLNHSLDVISQPGRGSVFAITVPQSEIAPLVDTTRTRLTDNLGKFNGEHILVIDDELMIRRSMYSLLTHWGCNVTTAASGHEACKLLTPETPLPDVIITDYHLNNNETGIDAIQQINNKLNANFPVIVITGDTSSELIQKIHSRGYKFLHKPVAAGKLRSLIRYFTENEANLHTKEGEGRIEKFD